LYSRIPKDHLHGNEQPGLNFRSGLFFRSNTAEVFSATCLYSHNSANYQKKDALWAAIAEKIKQLAFVHPALLGPYPDSAADSERGSCTDNFQFTVKLVALAALPPVVVTFMGPLFAPLGTVAVMVSESITVNPADLPANITLDTPVKFDPLIVTCVPTAPLGGEKPVMVGGGMNVKLAPLVATPAGVVTESGPLVAPFGTVAMIFMPLNLKVALVPLKVTRVAPFRFVPLMVTAVPIPPIVGEKLVMVGGAPPVTLKFVALFALPPGVVTEIGPVLAPVGTVAVI
jgi:hypothetical protein